jgi:hypothetical protein
MQNLQQSPHLTDYSMELFKSLSAGQQYDYESGNPVDHSSLMNDAAEHIINLEAKLATLQAQVSNTMKSHLPDMEVFAKQLCAENFQLDSNRTASHFQEKSYLPSDGQPAWSLYIDEAKRALSALARLSSQHLVS